MPPTTLVAPPAHRETWCELRGDRLRARGGPPGRPAPPSGPTTPDSRNSRNVFDTTSSERVRREDLGRTVEGIRRPACSHHRSGALFERSTDRYCRVLAAPNLIPTDGRARLATPTQVTALGRSRPGRRTRRCRSAPQRSVRDARSDVGVAHSGGRGQSCRIRSNATTSVEHRRHAVSRCSFQAPASAPEASRGRSWKARADSVGRRTTLGCAAARAWERSSTVGSAR